MTALVLLASEAVAEKTWWNPYVKGALIAVIAVVLFAGSAHLLLSTNVGSRLAFLVTAAAFTGFMTLLSFAWITAQFPQGPLGPPPRWRVEEVVPDLSASRIERVRELGRTPQPAPAEAAAQIKADLDQELTNGDGRFDLFGDPTDYLAVQTLSVGGGRKWPFWWTEKTHYGAVQVCPVLERKVPFGAKPPTPECDPAQGTQWVVTVRDLGARRQPSFLIFGGSLVLFALTLVALNRYEKEQAALAAAVSGDGQRGGASGDGAAASGDGAGAAEPAERVEG